MLKRLLAVAGALALAVALLICAYWAARQGAQDRPAETASPAAAPASPPAAAKTPAFEATPGAEPVVSPTPAELLPPAEVASAVDVPPPVGPIDSTTASAASAVAPDGTALQTTAPALALPNGYVAGASEGTVPQATTGHTEMSPVYVYGEPTAERLPDPARGVSQWNRSEFEQLMAPELQGRDVLTRLPDGPVIVQNKPLTIEELLGANRAETPIAYGAPSLVENILRPASRRDPDLKETTGDLPKGQIALSSTGFLDYDEESRFVYGQGRLTARYGRYKLEADRMLVDTRLKEIQAYGNVLLTSDDEHVEAESMWVSAETDQGVAYNVRGRQGPFYFMGEPMEDRSGTTFRQLNREEGLFQNASFTTCDFPVPHYRLHAKEFSILYGERILARNVVLYIREIPVLWIPFYSQSLKERSPWAFKIGTDGELGFFFRTFYTFYHSNYEPSDVDESIEVRTEYGRARLNVDYFSSRGIGRGIEYDYLLSGGRHYGEFKAYGLDDSKRDVSNETTSDRYMINAFHRSRISENTQWLVNADWLSDPDIFFDIFDRIGSGRKRERIPERFVGTGVEYTGENFFAGLQIEIRERIGRDRMSEFAEPRDNDQDYDRKFNTEQNFTLLAPGFGPDGKFYDSAGTFSDPRSVEGPIEKGVSSSRYGRVTERLPQLTVSSNRMRLWSLPLWYHMDLNVFNNLDKGLNVVGTRDDSYVHGFDFYQSLSHLLRFNDRYTLLTKFGLGMGIAHRAEDSYNIEFPAGATFPFVVDGQRLGGRTEGLTFIDKDTFLVGTKEMSLRDVQPAFVYGDIDSRFNARLNDSLTAWIRYRLREGTRNTLGEFYESIGARQSRDDLYAFRNREHWLESGLTYDLIAPRLNANLGVGSTLESKSDHTPNELLRYGTTNLSWYNLRETIFVSAGVTYQERQLRDPSDPFQYLQNSLNYYLVSSYRPVHQRYYGRAEAFLIQTLNDDPKGSSDDRRFFDSRNESVLNLTAGTKIGNKYLLEVKTRTRASRENFTDTVIKLDRDLHDMVASLQVAFKGARLSSSREATTQDSAQVSLNFRFKSPGEKGLQPFVRSANLYKASKVGAFETDL